MTTPTYSPLDIVNFAAEKDAVKISAAFHDLIGQRVVDAIQARKQEVAAAMFNPPVEASDEAETEVEQDMEQTDNEVVDQAGDEEQTEQETEESDENTEVTN